MLDSPPMPPPPNDPPKRPGVVETLTAAPSAEATSPAPAPPEDDTCDPQRYDVVGEHGRGGLGRVLRAFDRRLGRTVAIKELLHRGNENEARFVREALLTARLEHPSIVAVHDAGRWPSGDRFYSMKLISGRSLKELINERPLLSDRLGLLSNLIAVADAVAYAHSHGVIHRDLKPANIIVGDYGETAVIDWGLAKELSETAEDAARLRGRPHARMRGRYVDSVLARRHTAWSGLCTRTVSRHRRRHHAGAAGAALVVRRLAHACRSGTRPSPIRDLRRRCVCEGLGLAKVGTRCAVART